MVENILLSWSGGKDSALALYELAQDTSYRVSALLTTVTRDYDRISIHGVRRALLEAQVSSLGYPLEQVLISKCASNEEYDAAMADKLKACVSNGISSVAYGDIFLEHLRKYREDSLAAIGMRAIFPLWNKDTALLARRFISLGFKAVITCVDSTVLDKSFAGRMFDETFLNDLPANVDACGENGEFHSFVFDGPVFSTRLNIQIGEKVLRDNRFYFTDLLPA